MTLLTINPTASSHDAWEAGTGAMTLTAEVRLTAATAWGGLLLPGVTVPVGATINSATLYYKASAGSHDDPAMNWRVQAADTAAVFASTNGNITDRSLGTASTNDTATGIGTTNWRTVNITAHVAEIVARGGWASGNNIALIADAQSAVDLWIRAYDSGGDVWYVEIDYTSGMNGAGAATLGAVTGSAAAVLPGHGTASSTLGAVTTSAAGVLATHGAGDSTLGVITTTAAGVLPIKGAAGAAAGSFTLDIAAGGDDGHEAADGTVFLDGAYELLYTNRQAGYIFRNIDIPAGATITAAYINVVVVSFDDPNPNLTIRGEYAPADFTTASHDLSSRTKTTAGVAWIAADIGVNAYRASPDISAVLNEIVGAGGWASGDDLALYLIDNGAGGAFSQSPMKTKPTARLSLSLNGRYRQPAMS